MPRQLLLIDNDPEAARTLTRHLTDAGHEVRHASGGIRGLTLVREARPDLVLLDLCLPDLDAVEVVARLRRTSRVPVVVLTTPDRSDRHAQVLGSGADDYLCKPVDRDELLGVVRARLSPRADGDIRVGALELRPSDRTCFYRDVQLRLTAKEFELIALLAR